MFDILDISTYDEAPDEDIIINGKRIFDTTKQKYFSTKEVATIIKNLENVFRKDDLYYRLSPEGIGKFLTAMYKNQLVHEENEKENESGIVMSDLTIKDYHFSVAQKELMKYLSQEEKEKLTNVILNHLKNKQQKYRLKQDIFDNLAGKIDNYFFSDLCYVQDVETEKELMYDYYSGFDTIESKEELEEILNNEYLNLYPDLKNEVREELLYLNF